MLPRWHCARFRANALRDQRLEDPGPVPRLFSNVALKPALTNASQSTSRRSCGELHHIPAKICANQPVPRSYCTFPAVWAKRTKILNAQGEAPNCLFTDKLGSYRVAVREVLVVVMPTYYTGTHRECAKMIGTDRALDPDRYFIVVPNLMGNGLSSSPSNSGAARGLTETHRHCHFRGRFGTLGR